MTCSTPVVTQVWNGVSSDYLTCGIGLESDCFTFANPIDSLTPTNQVPPNGFISTNNCNIVIYGGCHSIPFQVSTFSMLLALYTQVNTNYTTYSLISTFNSSGCDS